MPGITAAIRTARGRLRHLQSAQEWLAKSPESIALRNCHLVYFNGAFSPPTRAHAHIVTTIASYPGVDALWLDPEPARSQKPLWLNETFDARVEMCEQMLVDLHGGTRTMRTVGVGTLRRDLGPDLGESVELFQVLRCLLGGSGHGRLTWALGADVLENMRFWDSKARAFLQPGLTCDCLLVFMREGWAEEQLRDSASTVFGRDLADDELILLPMPDSLASVSSSKARQALVQRSVDQSPLELSSLLLPGVHKTCMTHPGVLEVYKDQVASLAR
jgi:nicotinic acid mononucleotide adenylyltransferase